MERTYANLLIKGMTGFMQSEAKQQATENAEELRLVIKIEKGKLGAFLFKESKFVRQVSFLDLVKLLIPS